MEIDMVAPILLLISPLLLTISTAKEIDQEFNAAISALRSHGYTLFPNAIATSDLSLRLHAATATNSTFTLFAPRDPQLFSLDLSSWAPHYTASLLLHVSPSRLPASYLRRLASSHHSLGGPYLKTLLPNRALHIERSRVMLNGTVLESVTVDGVRVLVPDLFLGPCIAVHGLEGILVGGYVPGTDDYGADLGFEDWVSPASSPGILSPEPMRTTVKVEGIDDNGYGRFFKFNRWFTA